MTRCVEFYEKVERDGYEWCTKDPATISRINSFLKVANELSRRGIEKKLTFGNLSEGVIRPLLSVKDEKLQAEILDKIAETLKQKGKISVADIQTWIKERKEKEATPLSEKKTPSPPAKLAKKILCMYYPRDWKEGDPCHAPDQILEKCDETKRNAKNCPIPIIVVPPPRTLAEIMYDTRETSDTGEQDSISGEQNTTQQVPRTASVLQPPNPDIQKHEITARRYAQVALRQYVHYKFAEDEHQAAQMAFDKGIETILDEVENRCMTEGEGEEE